MQKEYIGHNAITDLQSVLSACQTKHVFLVRGNRSYRACGAEELLTRIFEQLGIRVTEYKSFSVNPKIEEAQSGVEQLLQTDADTVLAVGGGSAIDMAKLIRHYAIESDFHARLMAVPTTAGTGAEATHFAVVYVDGKKQSIEADDILPDYAFVYPPFTYNNDTYLTACTGFDALAQAYEASWSKNRTEESDVYAQKAIGLLKENLLRLVEAPTTDLRDAVAEGAYWAGRAINITKTTAPHAFSYAFTSKCGYPHGHAVALTFPYFASLNLGKKELLAEFRQYANQLGLTFNGTQGENLMDLLHAVNLQRLANNPVEVKEKEIEELFNYLTSI